MIRVMEVGPRDGLQNEPRPVETELKWKWLQALQQAGIKEFELGALVRADKVPQMADTENLYLKFKKSAWAESSKALVLVPNEKGLDRALALGVQQIAVFTASTETFNQKNIGMSISESLEGIRRIVIRAKKAKVRVRGYVSTAWGCPFEGAVLPKKALKVCEALLDAGVWEVSIGDTIGVAQREGVRTLLKQAIKAFGSTQLAVHFHDTFGQALVNTAEALSQGIRAVDASSGGLGGCPFAPGATGNLSTEDLVYFLQGEGLKTGIDFEKLCRANLDFLQSFGRPISSRALMAFAAKQKLK